MCEKNIFENNNIKHVINEKIEYIQFKKLLEYPEINHAYILKPNNMNFRMKTNFRNIEIVKNNLRRVCDALGFEFNTILRPDYNHTNNVNIIKKGTVNTELSNNENINSKVLIDEMSNSFEIIFSEEKPSLKGEMFKDTDGIVTNQNEMTLMSTNADCNLILIYDPVKKVFGNIHAGWRGTFGKIAKNAIRKMKEEFDCNPKDIICCFCPSIRKCHFEVDTDVANECIKIFENTGRLDEIIQEGLIKNGKQKYYIDTLLINKILLIEEGILENNIFDSEICSVCSCDKVHSRRAEGDDFELGCALIQLK